MNRYEMPGRPGSRWVVVSLLTGATGIACATTQTFSSRSAFVAAAAPQTLLTFESDPVGRQGFDDFLATSSTSGGYDAGVEDPSFGGFPSRALIAGNADDVLIIDFFDDAESVGFQVGGLGWNDPLNALPLAYSVLDRNGTVLASGSIPTSGRAMTTFLGFTSTEGIAGVRIAGVAVPDLDSPFVVVDDMAYTIADPAPRTDAGQRYRLAGANALLTTGSQQWNWDGGPRLAAFREALADPRNFGPSGVISRAIEQRTVSSLELGAFVGLDGLIVTWWADVDISASQREQVAQYFLAGGDLILLQDDPVHDPIGERLGIPTVANPAGTASGTSFLFDGPFGTVASASQSGLGGRLDEADVLSSGGRVVARDEAGLPIAAAWDRRAYSQASGRLLIITDVDMFADRTATFAPDNDNGRFALNAMAWFTDRTYRLGGATSSLTPGASAWSWERERLAPFRAALGDASNFGRWGIVPRVIETVDFELFDVRTFSDLDGIIVTWWNDADLTPAERAEVIGFMENGGDLIILQDSPANDPIGESLGVPTIPGTPNDASNGTSFVFDGPFGEASSVRQSGEAGYLDFADVLATNGQVIARNESNRITGAIWPAGTFTPRAGRVILFTDVDMFSDIRAEYTPPNDNGRFALNAMAWIAADRYTLTGHTTALTPGSTVWSWGDRGGLMGGYRDAVEELQLFGPGAPGGTAIETLNLTNAGTTAPRIYRADGIVASYLSDADWSAGELDIIEAFFHNGGDLLVLADSPSFDPVNERLGIPTFATTSGTTSTVTGFAFDGPFGQVAGVTRVNVVGQLAAPDLRDTGGRVLATNELGHITAASWDRNDYAPGTGQLVIVTDVDTFARSTALTNYFPGLTENARFAANITARLVEEPATCSPADLAMPFGQLDIFDILEFFDRFGLANATTDLTGDGVYDIFDIIAFFNRFGAGC